jgi:hypothetical protein
MERFSLKKLNKVEGKEQYHIEVSNRFAALENLDSEVDVLTKDYQNYLIKGNKPYCSGYWIQTL